MTAPPDRPLRVLVVDDSRDAADSLADLLALWGHDARAAYSGAAALELARDFGPHAVLLDLGMPGADGWEVARQFRADPTTRAAVLLAVSGYGQPEDVRRSLGAGFHAHLTKPADPQQIKDLLARLAAAVPLG